jgi:hypothetical protein
MKVSESKVFRQEVAKTFRMASSPFCMAPSPLAFLSGPEQRIMQCPWKGREPPRGFH